MWLLGWAWLGGRLGTDDGGCGWPAAGLFHLRGLSGELYWAAIRPFHDVVFGGMRRNIAQAADGKEQS